MLSHFDFLISDNLAVAAGKRDLPALGANLIQAEFSAVQRILASVEVYHKGATI